MTPHTFHSTSLQKSAKELHKKFFVTNRTRGEFQLMIISSFFPIKGIGNIASQRLRVPPGVKGGHLSQYPQSTLQGLQLFDTEVGPFSSFCPKIQLVSFEENKIGTFFAFLHRKYSPINCTGVLLCQSVWRYTHEPILSHDYTFQDILTNIKRRSSRRILHRIYTNHKFCCFENTWSFVSITRKRLGLIKTYFWAVAEKHLFQ